MSFIPSTINRNNPPANSPVASSVVRQNFNNAANDIEALWNYVQGLVTGVSSFNGRAGVVVLSSTDVNNALGFDPSKKAGNLHWISPVANTIYLVPYAEYGFTVNRLNNLSVSSGSLTISLLINGAAISGLTNIAVTTAPQNPLATANNVAGIGNELSMVVSNVVGAANLKFSMLATV